ncbi:MAG: hypothetical protein WC444_05790 [Candidatus Paceibacterota bacterium]
MTKLGCEACKGVFSSFDAIRVIEADGDEYVFCCMSCVEDHYFPDHKEKDQEIARLKGVGVIEKGTLACICPDCKFLHGDWCHNPSSEIQEQCFFYCYGEMSDCPDYKPIEEKSKETEIKRRE